MEDYSLANKHSLEEFRKNFPRAGKKWEPEEDERLKTFYQNFANKDLAAFESFLQELTKEFGRAQGGLKSRLAKHFTDVPGWDYSRQEQKREELDRLTQAAIQPKQAEILVLEYQKYLEGKKETYVAFLRRMAEALKNTEKKLFTHYLTQKLGAVKKYKKLDINSYGQHKTQAKPEVPVFDASKNPQAAEALRILQETNDNLFLTGEAGTGKSTLLNYFRRTTGKNTAVLAPTGVAAINVEGQTIHSFCGFGPDITLQKVKKLSAQDPKFKLLQKLETLIIDEISMVRADLLDCVDKFLKQNGPLPALPFGGVQMVFIGDLYQLPPVDKDFVAGDGLLKIYESPYFFSSRAFKRAKFRFVRLKTVYRQKDPGFIEVLNAVRNNSVLPKHLEILNTRHAYKGEGFKFEKFAVYLTPHNARAQKVNNFFLQQLKTEPKTYVGQARGSFTDRNLPTDLELRVKIGAQIMMLNNDFRKRWVNGTMGKIVRIIPAAAGIPEEESDELEYVDEEENPHGSAAPALSGSDTVVAELENGETVYVKPHTWEMFKFVVDRQSQKIDSQATGSFTQYPFKLAWAVTIHKAQGKTFDKVYIDLSSGTFAHGQLYVALSRCRSLEGLYLKRPITGEDIILDQRVAEFLQAFEAGQE